MDTTFLAKAIGLFELLNGVSMVVRRDVVLEAFREMNRNRALSYVVGMVLTIIGVTVVVGHTVFDDFLSSVVTLVGWLLLLEGSVYLFLPASLVQRYLEPLNRPAPYFMIATGYLAVSSVLLFSVFMVK